MESPHKRPRLTRSDTTIIAHFVYFGFGFFQEDFSVPSNSNTVHVTSLDTLPWSNFIDKIRKDTELLNKGCFGAKTVAERNKEGEFEEWEASGYFTKSSRSCNTFYYNHTYHAKFSGIHLSQFARLISLPQPEEVAYGACMKHTDHYTLLSFFLDNIGLELRYKKILETLGHSLPAEKRRFLENSLTILQSGSVADTPYDFNTSRKNGWDYHENDWTKRLKFVLDDLYPDLQILLTAEKKASSVNPTAVDVFEPIEVYPLRGAPDILFRNRALVTQPREDEEETTYEEEEETTSADEAVENTHQRTNLTSKGAATNYLPEKMGELISALHFLLVSKVIRGKQKGKERDSYSVWGLLIDKITGTISCKLSGGIGKNVTIEEIEVNRCSLTPADLCVVLDKFVPI